MIIRIANATSLLPVINDSEKEFFENLLSAGIMFPPSQFEAVFLSLSHTEKDVNKTLNALYRSLKNL